MATDPRKPLRKDLSSFLPNQRLVRAFEELFELVPDGMENTATEALSAVLSAAVAEATARIATDDAEQAATQVQTLPEYDPVCDDESPAPRHEIGDVATQNADAIEISGGVVMAALTDTTSVLLASSQPLADGSAGAVATLTNAPVAGAPSKWVQVDDSGTTRYLPLW